MISLSLPLSLGKFSQSENETVTRKFIFLKNLCFPFSQIDSVAVDSKDNESESDKKSVFCFLIFSLPFVPYDCSGSKLTHLYVDIIKSNSFRARVAIRRKLL